MEAAPAQTSHASALRTVRWLSVTAVLCAGVAVAFCVTRLWPSWIAGATVSAAVGVILAWRARQTAVRSGVDFDGRLSLLAFLVALAALIYIGPAAVVALLA